MHDRRDGVGKPVFNFAPLGHEHKINVSLLLICVHISDVVLRQFVCEASKSGSQSRGQCVMAAPLLPRR